MVPSPSNLWHLRTRGQNLGVFKTFSWDLKTALVPVAAIHGTTWWPSLEWTEKQAKTCSSQNGGALTKTQILDRVGGFMLSQMLQLRPSFWKSLGPRWRPQATACAVRQFSTSPSCIWGWRANSYLGGIPCFHQTACGVKIWCFGYVEPVAILPKVHKHKHTCKHTHISIILT